MSKLSIVAEPSPILRLISTEVPIQKIGSKKIQDLIRDMSETLRGIEVGIVLAAPQVGEIIYGKVDRFEKISVEAYNEHGKKFKVGAKGLFAQVLQHEMDHLDGILFIDKAKEIRKIPREEVNL